MAQSVEKSPFDILRSQAKKYKHAGATTEQFISNLINTLEVFCPSDQAYQVLAYIEQSEKLDRMEKLNAGTSRFNS
jgi:hypothetical protein